MLQPVMLNRVLALFTSFSQRYGESEARLARRHGVAGDEEAGNRQQCHRAI